MKGTPEYTMSCCEFHRTGGHSADPHGIYAATATYAVTDVDAHLRQRDVLNRNARLKRRRGPYLKAGSIADQVRAFVYACGVGVSGDILRGTDARTWNQVAIACRDEAGSGRLVRLFYGVFAAPEFAAAYDILLEAWRSGSEPFDMLVAALDLWRRRSASAVADVAEGDAFLVDGVALEVTAVWGEDFYLESPPVGGERVSRTMKATELRACARARSL